MKHHKTDFDFDSDDRVVPPAGGSRPSLVSINPGAYVSLRDDVLKRLDKNLGELQTLADELYKIESGGVGLSDAHDAEDLVECMARLKFIVDKICKGN